MTKRKKSPSPSQSLPVLFIRVEPELRDAIRAAAKRSKEAEAVWVRQQLREAVAK